MFDSDWKFLNLYSTQNSVNPALLTTLLPYISVSWNDKSTHLEFKVTDFLLSVPVCHYSKFKMFCSICHRAWHVVLKAKLFRRKICRLSPHPKSRELETGWQTVARHNHQIFTRAHSENLKLLSPIAEAQDYPFSLPSSLHQNQLEM